VVELAVEPRNVYLAVEPIVSSDNREPSVNSGRLLCRLRHVFEHSRAFLSVKVTIVIQPRADRLMYTLIL